MAGEKRVRWEMSAQDDVTEVLEKIMSKVSIADGLFSKLGGVMGGILAGISVAGLIAATKSVVEAGDAALKTSQKVGVSVEAWQQLDYAAKLAGLSSESLQKALKGLSTVALEAADGGAAAQDIFKRLGVDVLDTAGKIKPTEKLLLDLAERFSTMPDGIEKTAAATKIFGKAGLDLIPFLNQGRDGIEALMLEAERLGIVMDSKTAAAAEALNDNLTRLSSATRGMMVQAIAPLIPFLTQMSDEMVKAKTSGDGMNRMSEAITTGLQIVGSTLLTVKALFEQVGNTIGGFFAAAIASFSGEFKREQEIWKQVDRDNMGVRDRLGKDLDALWNGVEVGATKAKVAVKGLGEATATTGNLMKEWIALRDKLDSKDGGKAFEVDPSFFKDYELLNTLFKAKIIPTLDEYNRRLGQLMDRQPFMKTAREEEKKAIEEIAKAELSLSDAYRASVTSADNMIGSIARGNKDLEFETSLIGKTTLERDLAIVSRAKEKDMMAAVTPEQRALVEQIYAEREALVRTRDARQLSVDSERTFWDQVGGFVDGFARSLTNGVGGAIDYLKKQFKSLLADMLAIFLRRWVLNMVAGGSIFGAAGDALAGGVGGNSLAGAGLSALGGYTGASTFLEGISMGFRSGVAAQGAIGEQVGVWLANYGWVAGVAAAILATGFTANALFTRGWTAQGLPSGGAHSFPGFTGVMETGLADRLLRGIGFSDRLAAIFSGSSVMDRLWGHGATHADAQGIQGDFSGTNLSARNWQDFSQRGGVFSSDRRWTETAALDPGQQAFFTSMMAGISSTLGSIGQSLGVDPQAALSGYSRSFNIQTTNNGQLLSDEEMRTQFGNLFAGVLQDEVSILLSSSGHTALADYVKGLTGSGEQIASSIEELSVVMAAVPELHMPGLTPEAILAWRQGTETIGQTFQRVAGQLSSFDNQFMTDAQKLEAARTRVNSVFSELGIAIPESTGAFYDLVHGLDLGTESGRHMFDALMAVAPAFLTVSSAAQNAAAGAAAAVAQFNSIAGQLSPSFGAANARSQLDAAVNAWRALGNNGQRTTEQTIQDIANLISSGQIGTALTYAQSLGGNAVSILNQMLAAYQTWQQSLSGGATTIGTTVGAVGDLGDAANAAAFALFQAKQGLADYLVGLRSGSLSPASPMERLDAARVNWESILKLAQGGDAGAISQLAGATDAYLQIARELFASSSQFVDIFNRVYAADAGVAGVPGDWQSSLVSALPQSSPMASQADIQALTGAIREYLAAVALGNDTNAQKTNTLLGKIAGTSNSEASRR